MNLKGKHVLVMGMGETGLSIAKWLTRQNAMIRVADSRINPPNVTALESLVPEMEICTGPFEDKVFNGIELIAMSPGVPMKEPHVQLAIERGVPIVGDLTLFQWALAKYQVSRPKIIAITGTNGKTTVTAMVGAMLKKAGLDVEVAGNISPAVLNAFMRRLDDGRLPEFWVLEVSSFQLELTEYMNADVATVLNLSEDHLDRYDSMHDYVLAKTRIFMHEKQSAGIQILNRDNRESIAMSKPEKSKVTFGLNAPATEIDFGVIRNDDDVWLMEGRMLLMKTSELAVNGLHNAANALAALALCRALQVPIEPLLSALREFQGLPHRMERVAAFNDVTFINDSKSTNIGSTVAALKGLQQHVVLIAGGDGKEQDFSALREVVAECTRAVVLIGRDAGQIASALNGCGVPIHFAKTMDKAIQKSFLMAQKDDVVLLSPACASFDMFRNYVHRAEVFISAVKDIEARFFSVGKKKH
ncbi:UDP-N-acetylmuramoylalanine--D-glutamate ligase [Nitrosomonas aestuarii]|uniref:UDP-N-acetylmuramoylalanine--D-glutamate ligase n=1 Tax=Nitrosomonas aestuarii TaxID=52441 RepID=A0A1I3Z5Y5_9PROT|nr:UDP-N-acetylmuramoyl-L-alanine--D-glutamate ligase [Nitrosomonas aestuarii]SFK39492.1 UDP-N-acetylmuramoylalanine--D-glutamate ligase [Nitrosomonas aestuarii]